MRAVRVLEYGGPEVMRQVEVDTPQPGPGQVLVRIRAAAVSGFDLMFRKGTLKQIPGRPPFTLPFQLGREGAGEIAALGTGVRGWQVGDRVVLMTSPACGHCPWCKRGEDALCVVADQPGQTRFGTQAEYVVYPTGELIRAPDGAAFETLAAAVQNFATIWHGAFARAGITAGQDVLITGAGGGLGTAAIEVCRFAGARTVIAVTGVSEKAERLRNLGAHHVFNWRTQDVVAGTRDVTGGIGVDVVLDNVGGPLFNLSLAVVRLGGTVVAASEAAGSIVEMHLGQLFGRHLNVLGTRASSRTDQETVVSLVGTGRLKPVIAGVFPFAEIAEVHRMLESGTAIGKFVVVP